MTNTALLHQYIPKVGNLYVADFRTLISPRGPKRFETFFRHEESPDHWLQSDSGGGVDVEHGDSLLCLQSCVMANGNAIWRSIDVEPYSRLSSGEHVPLEIAHIIPYPGPPVGYRLHVFLHGDGRIITMSGQFVLPIADAHKISLKLPPLVNRLLPHRALQLK